MQKNICVVAADDSRISVLRIARLLSEIEGVELVGTANDGVAALRVIADCRPDWLLLDMVMPELSGLEVLRMVRSLYPELRTAMVTSMAHSEHADDALRLGAVQVLGKPVEQDQLAALFESECGQPDRS